MNHHQWKLTRDKKAVDGHQEGPKEAALAAELDAAWDLGQAVYDRRTELGLSQAELALRAGMAQPKISNIEGGDGIPTIPLLLRLAQALDARLVISLDEGTSAFTFHPHASSAPPRHDVA
ncbi:helix-turn-helix domain-containing protein [Streptomyces sp. NPDC091292]|uniref:helix-turn-helix domain-containing protein n=1 Tax=Streptomyces sp. NPDC091292 TaxID=3365991 RepID=UPI00382209D7